MGERIDLRTYQPQGSGSIDLRTYQPPSEGPTLRDAPQEVQDLLLQGMGVSDAPEQVQDLVLGFLQDYAEPSIDEDISELPEMFARGVTQIPGSIADLSNLAMQGAGWGVRQMGAPETGAFMQNEMQIPYGAQWFDENIGNALMGDRPEPNTGFGNILQQAAEWGGNSMVPWARANAVTVPMGLAGGAVAGGLEEAGAPEWMQILGGVGTMAGAGIGASRLTGGGRLASDALSGLTPDDIARGVATSGQAQSIGVPLMASEALDSPGLQQLVGDILATGGRGANELQAFLTQRPGQVRQAGEAGISGVSPNMTLSPDEVLRDVNTTGETIIRSAEGERSAASSPLYQAAEGQVLDPAAIVELPDGRATSLNDLLAQIDERIALGSAGSRSRTALERLRDDIAAATNASGEFTASALDDVYAGWRDRANAQGNIMNDPEALDRRTAGTLQPFLQDLGAVTASNPNIGAGREAYIALTPEVDRVRGTDAVPAGPQELATARTVDDAAGTFLNPNTARPSTIDELLRDVREAGAEFGEAGPEQTAAMMGSVQDLLRTYLENRFNRATADLQSGERLTGGARFAADVAGNQQAEENLMFLLREISPDVQQGFENMLEIFRRTGVTPSAGSPTAGRGPRMETAGQNVVSGVADALPIIGSGHGLAGGVSSWMRRLTQGRNYGRIADYLVSPDGIQQLQELARLGPYDNRAAAIVATMLLGANQTSD